MTDRENDYPRGTVEFVKATVTSADPDIELDDQPVYIALSRGDDHDWLAAHWLATAGTTRKARTDAPVSFTADAYPHTSYDVLVKVTDDPEAPILRAGSLTIS